MWLVVHGGRRNLLVRDGMGSRAEAAEAAEAWCSERGIGSDDAECFEYDERFLGAISEKCAYGLVPVVPRSAVVAAKQNLVLGYSAPDGRSPEVAMLLAETLTEHTCGMTFTFNANVPRAEFSPVGSRTEAEGECWLDEMSAPHRAVVVFGSPAPKFYVNPLIARETLFVPRARRNR